MRFSPGRLNAHISGIGQDVQWRRAYACPCVSPDSGAAKPTCPLCTGRGQTWAAAVSTRVGLTSQTASKMMAQFGAYEVGDVLITLPSNSPAYVAGRFDRFLALKSTNPFSMVLTRGEDDRLLGAAQSFTRCYWINDAGTAEVEGGLPTADASGNLTWASGAPPAGKQYSLSGVRFDEYMLYPELPMDRNHNNGLALPRRVRAKQFSLFGR